MVIVKHSQYRARSVYAHFQSEMRSPVVSITPLSESILLLSEYMSTEFSLDSRPAWKMRSKQCGVQVSMLYSRSHLLHWGQMSWFGEKQFFFYFSPFWKQVSPSDFWIDPRLRSVWLWFWIWESFLEEITSMMVWLSIVEGEFETGNKDDIFFYLFFYFYNHSWILKAFVS